VQTTKFATAFASIFNNSGAAANGCGIVPVTSVPATFSFQTTNPATNTLTGTPNTRVAIPAGGVQTFLMFCNFSGSCSSRTMMPRTAGLLYSRTRLPARG
jgi:hypothetical protein